MPIVVSRHRDSRQPVGCTFSKMESNRSSVIPPTIFVDAASVWCRTDARNAAVEKATSERTENDSIQKTVSATLTQCHCPTLKRP